MRLLFVQEAVYYQYKNNYYSPRITYETYWERYLKHFEKVYVLARVKKVNTLPVGYHKANGKNVYFTPLPFYQGLVGFYKKRATLKKILKNTFQLNCAYVLRIPGPLGSLMGKLLHNKNIPYAVEVVGDPYEVAKFISLPFFIKPVLRYGSYYTMQKTVKRAMAAIYVTKSNLQKRYPIPLGRPTAYASNVILEKSSIINPAHRLAHFSSIKERLQGAYKKPVKLGALGMLYSIKSPLEIVKSVYLLIKKGLNVQLYFAGDGPQKEKIESLTKKLGISERVICLGNIASGEKVFNFLDSLDVYIQFSKTEGIPRAMLEAMARGCPVIASNVGGVPELLDEEYLVKSGDTNALAKKINNLLLDEHKLKKSVIQNIATAKKYSLPVLKKKRQEFYSNVIELYQKRFKA